MTHPLFELTAVHLQQGGRSLCQGFHWQVQAGEIWGLLGANGRGKTTLLHSLAGLHPLFSGRLLFRQRPLNHWPRRLLAQHLGLLTQAPSYPFPLSVQAFVSQGLYPFEGFWHSRTQAQIQSVDAALERTHLTALAHRPLQQLSGGECQRAGIASLLVQNCPVLLLDEPCNHLDIPHQMHLLQALIHQTQRQQGACIISLHDINLAARFCTHIALLAHDGWHTGPAQQCLQPAPLSHTFQYPIESHSTPQGPVFLPRPPPAYEAL